MPNENGSMYYNNIILYGYIVYSGLDRDRSFFSFPDGWMYKKECDWKTVKFTVRAAILFVPRPRD